MDQLEVCMSMVDVGKISQLTAHLERCDTCHISRLTPRRSRICAAGAFLMHETLLILRTQVAPAYDLAMAEGR